MNEERNELLARGIETIRTYGWCRGDWNDEDGRACLLGSFNFGFGTNCLKAPYRDAETAIERVLERYPKTPDPTTRRAAYVNDNLIVDADEAIEVLKLAMDEP